MLGPFVSRRELKPGDIYDVPSMMPHMFIVHGGGVLYEEYFPDRGGTVWRDDIVRLIEGGRLEISKLSGLPACLFNMVSLPDFKNN